MKKIISLVLVFVLISAFPLVSGAEDAPELKIAVASDIHYNLPDEALTYFTEDPVFGYANRRAAMENESGFILDSFLQSCEERKVDFVLISGDLADNGRTIPREHYIVRDKLLSFEKRTGIDVFVIDGNHDLGENCATGISEFKEIYKDLGYDRALTVRETDCSYTADLGDKYRLIAVDSCDPAVSTEDGMTADKVLWTLEQAKKAYDDGRYPILMMHHNLLDHLPLQRILSHNFIIRNHLAVAGLFADARIRVALTGHEHCSDAAVYTSNLGNKIYDFATTSLTMYPLAYREFTFTDNKINYEQVKIDGVDTAALSRAVEGYTETQLSLMNADLNAFSKQYLKKGVEYRLSLQLTSEKSGIEENSVLYGLVESAYTNLKNLLSMPLYGENSVSETASKYNIDIPKTGYSTGWDLATEFVAAHYAGEEDFDIAGAEVTALLRTASLILKYLPDEISDDLFDGAAAAVVNALTLSDVKALCRSVFGGVTPGEYFAAALVSGLVYGFTSDTDGVPDNNGMIDGYGEKDGVKNITEKIISFFTKLFTLIKNYFVMLLPKAV